MFQSTSRRRSRAAAAQGTRSATAQPMYTIEAPGMLLPRSSSDLIAPVTSLQPPYSMLRRAAEKELLPFAQANGIGVINYSPMVSGLLTGMMTAERIAAFPADDWRRRAAECNEPRLGRNLRLVELLREIGNGHGVSPGVVAVAWTLHHPAITAAIVGGRSASQVEEMASAFNFRLSEDEFARINAFLDANPV